MGDTYSHILKIHKELIGRLTKNNYEEYVDFLKDKILPNLESVATESEHAKGVDNYYRLDLEYELEVECTEDNIILYIGEYFVIIDVRVFATYIHFYSSVPYKYTDEFFYNQKNSLEDNRECFYNTCEKINKGPVECIRHIYNEGERGLIHSTDKFLPKEEINLLISQGLLHVKNKKCIVYKEYDGFMFYETREISSF